MVLLMKNKEVFERYVTADTPPRVCSRVAGASVSGRPENVLDFCPLVSVDCLPFSFVHR